MSSTSTSGGSSSVTSSSSSSAPSRFSSKLRAVDRLAPLNVKHNAEVIFFIRTFVSIMAGCCCGVLGLTNWNGFLFYILTTALTSVALIAKVGSANVTPYFTSINVLTIEGFTGGLLSYVLFWTLLYDIVYVY